MDKLQFLVLIPDNNSGQITKFSAQFKKLSQIQFSISCYGMSLTSDVSNLTC